MSNQKFRKEEPETPTHETRLAAARALIAAESARSAQHAEVIRNGVNAMYRDHGGNTLDLQIKGMALVIEEGSVYREEWIEYKAQLKAYHAGKRASEPRGTRQASDLRRHHGKRLTPAGDPERARKPAVRRHAN